MASINRCAKDIDTLIESLPNEDSSQELQIQSLKLLERENQDAAERLEEVSDAPNERRPQVREYILIVVLFFRSSEPVRACWRKSKQP